ncbi:MAG: penicillin-binding transpeptidase domain-containing protein [Bacillota bacterium]
MIKRLKKRELFIVIFFLIITVVYMYRLYDLTIINGDKYREKSINNRIIKIPTYAERGEIRDRNNVLLAGNEIGFTINFLNEGLTEDQINKVAIKIFDLLNNLEEDYLDFPIVYTKDKKFKFEYDIQKNKWLKENGFDLSITPKELIEYYRKKYFGSEKLDIDDTIFMLSKQGINLPINISEMKYKQDIEKEEFLDYYGLDLDIKARNAFEKIRNKNYYAIDKNYSDYEAYQILILKHSLLKKGYKKYEPVVISQSVSKDTAFKINELNLELPGVSVEPKPIRNYPKNEVAAHILGYMGHITTESEIKKYIKEKNYDRNSLIGKSGIEKKYEDKLAGENGYKYIEVNALGQFVKDVNDNYDNIQNKTSVSGENINLTIDVDLQKKVESHLKNAIEGISNGTKFKSKWGDYNYREKFDGAKSAAAVVVDVNNGDVLSLASSPSYDVNLFATGISQKDWQSLNPENKNNPLAPRPLYNLATRTVIQPGSIYKMVTGYAALSLGLDPEEKFVSDGYVEVGKNVYGCWLWNTRHAKHGLTNLYKAIEVSCNYYFFNVANGYDYYKDEELNFEMDSEKLIEVSKKFGLDESSGIELSEVVAGVPNPEKKKDMVKYYLKRKLNNIIEDYLKPEDYEKSEAIINEIISWSDKNLSRGSIISRLEKLDIIGNFNNRAKLADIIKYDYFNLMQWYEGDTLNYAIGQGNHQYTPVQIARYIAGIANGGKILDLNLLLESKKEINYELNPDYIRHLQKGMYRVANGTQGTASYIFRNFPIETAGKTGTAEKEGKIPPKDEVKYLKENYKKINSNLKLDDINKETQRIIIDRNQKIANLINHKNKLEKENPDEKEKLNELSNEINNLIKNGYLNKGHIMRQAIKNLSDRKILDEDINQYRKKYSDYAWYVAFAPYDNPEIAVVVLIPQGGHGSYAAPVAREIIGDYFKLEPFEN